MYLFITKNILEKSNALSMLSPEDYNFNIAFKLTLAGFLHLGEIIYIAIKLKNFCFVETLATRSNISFTKANQYIVHKFKFSKTEVKKLGI